MNFLLPSLLTCARVDTADAESPANGHVVDSGDEDAGPSEDSGEVPEPTSVTAWIRADWVVTEGELPKFSTGWGARDDAGTWLCTLTLPWTASAGRPPACPGCTWAFDALPGDQTTAEGPACDVLTLNDRDGSVLVPDLSTSWLGGPTWNAVAFDYDFEWAARSRSPDYMADTALLLYADGWGWSLIAQDDDNEYGDIDEIFGSASTGYALLLAGRGSYASDGSSLEVATSW